ncbi:unnamed protein product [Ixodes pacificus]
MMAASVLKHILERLMAAKYYSLILDCTPDISHTEKMSFTLRFLDTIDDKVPIQEHFIGFKTVCESTGEGLTKAIMSTLEEGDIMIEDCRGQGYDNGANMKGKGKVRRQEFLRKIPEQFFCFMWMPLSQSRGGG